MPSFLSPQKPSTTPAAGAPAGSSTVPCPKSAPAPGAAPGGGPGGAPSPGPPPDPGQEVYSKNIIIKGPKAFRDKVRKDLDDLAKTKTGKSILDALGDGKHPVTIVDMNKADAQANGGTCTPDDPAGASDPKKGSSSTVAYSPEFSADQYTDQNGKLVDHPSKAYLGHELIHAVHQSQGTDEESKPDPKEPGSNQEESKTIGINDHAGDAMTENNLLKDMGFNYTRTDHNMTAHTNS